MIISVIIISVMIERDMIRNGFIKKSILSLLLNKLSVTNLISRINNRRFLTLGFISTDQAQPLKNCGANLMVRITSAHILSQQRRLFNPVFPRHTKRIIKRIRYFFHIRAMKSRNIRKIINAVGMEKLFNALINPVDQLQIIANRRFCFSALAILCTRLRRDKFSRRLKRLTIAPLRRFNRRINRLNPF